MLEKGFLIVIKIICSVLLHTNDLINSLHHFCFSKLPPRKQLNLTSNRWSIPYFLKSRRALAVPVTFLILFASMLGVISFTYYFAIEKVNTHSSTLKIATAKEDMLSFDEKLCSALWHSGSTYTFEFSDSGGKLNIQPDANALIINVTDNNEVAATIFNETVGQVVYELPYSRTADIGLFLRGDSRTITNQSSALITQLFIRNGKQHPEILLRYRPIVSYTTAGVENDRAVNNVRIYVVNLNSSDAIALYGKVPLKIACVSTQIITTTYTLSYEPETLKITSIIDGLSSQVSIPIASTTGGAVINIETVLCNIAIQRGMK